MTYFPSVLFLFWIFANCSVLYTSVIATLFFPSSSSILPRAPFCILPFLPSLSFCGRSWMPRVVLEASAAASWTARRLMGGLGLAMTASSASLAVSASARPSSPGVGTRPPSGVEENYFFCTPYCLRGKN